MQHFRQLGFKTGRTAGSFGPVEEKFSMDDVNCRDDRIPAIQNCTYKLNHNCKYHEAAGVECSDRLFISTTRSTTKSTTKFTTKSTTKPPTTISIQTCPYGWKEFKGDCYKFISWKTTWSNADRNCKERKVQKVLSMK